MSIQIIVPAAGESRRFKRKGIHMPKPLIKFSWQDRPKQTMLEHAVFGLEQYPIHVGVLSSKHREFSKFPSRFYIHYLDESRGQAHTAGQVISNLTLPLLIINSDSMFLYPLETFIEQAKGFAGAAIVFEGGYDPRFSYVDNYPIFENAREKDPISPWALAGAFYFRSGSDFIKAYEEYSRQCKGEEYISEVYNFLPGRKLAVYCPRDQWVSWGTAEELMSDENVNDLEF